MVDAEQFFGQAVARTNPTTMNGLLRLVVECSVYFNEHHDSFNLLAQKLTYVIDSLYKRSKGSPSFENKVWAIALLSTAWNGFYREVRAIDDKNEEERKILESTESKLQEIIKSEKYLIDEKIRPKSFYTSLPTQSIN